MDKGIRGSEAMKAAILLVLATLPLTAHAAEPTGALTLACEGTTRLRIDGSPWSPDEPSSMSVIVNFTTRQRLSQASDTMTSAMTTNSPSE